ncbi:MAG: carboxymuconolactone decarboxylase family protein [Actinophytocola sp.]|uniref:carboxymuconolactone decarboxylase family protein n=1 Tax=Actinophytocola sp. TaxID=1872138 RepID=UPI003C776FA6
MADHPVLPLLDPATLDEAQRALYDRIAGGPRAGAAATVPVVDADGRLAGPFNGLLFAPELGDAVQAVGARIRFGLSLSDRERELATMLVAGRARCPYEVFAHRRLAAATGIPDDALDALSAGAIPELADERERQVLALCAALLDPAPDLAAVRTAAVDVGPRVVAELVMLIGYYQLLARLLHVAEVPGT